MTGGRSSLYVRALERAQNALRRTTSRPITQGSDPDERSAQSPSTPTRRSRPASSAGRMTKAGVGIAVVFLGHLAHPRLRRTAITGSASSTPTSIGWTYIVSIAIGMLWLVLLHHLVRGRWVDGRAPHRRGDDRRVPDHLHRRPRLHAAGAVRLPGPLLLGAPRRAQRDAQPDDRCTSSAGCRPASSRSATCIYGVDLHRHGLRTSRRSRASRTRPAIRSCPTQLRIASGPAMILFAFTTCFVAFDILMSLAPKWYSTIYGVDVLGLARASAAFAALGADRAVASSATAGSPTRSPRSTTTTSASGCSRSRSSGRTPRSPVHAAVVRQHAGGDGLVQVPDVRRVAVGVASRSSSASGRSRSCS